jgi:penicillin-binding protein 2
MRGRRKKIHDSEIEPDEILLDALNTPDFNRGRFEGRIERPLASSLYVTLGGVFGVLLLVLTFQAANLQLIHGVAFAAESAHNSLTSVTLFAPRGVIVDRTGVPLAENVELPNGAMAREYPYPSLGPIIGYVSYPKKDSSGNYYDTNETGVTGLEQEYNSLLSGGNGQVLTETDALGTIRSEGEIVPAKEGGTLHLSLDANLQKLFAQSIQDVTTSQGFIAGSGVILDVHTGQVLAIVSFPTYDPNVMASGSPADTIASYNTNPGHPFIDHAVQGVYAPGSIVKPLIASGALTDGIITPSTIIQDPGFLSLPDPYHPGKTFIYKGWKALGAVDVERAIAWSSDVFFYTVGGGFGSQKGLGIDRLDYWYSQFGLGKPTGIDLPDESAGLVPSPAWKKATLNQPWYLGDTYFTAIGQYSMQVTPIQMARATAAVANGGRLYTPTLLASQVPIYSTVPVDPSMLAVVRAGMRQGVTTALAKAINLPYVSVAAKTGTAQVGSANQFDNAWVEGFFPYENPEYAFAVVLERGPIGQGEEAVNVMQELFSSLHAEGSPYVGGTASTTASSTNSVSQ